VGIECTLSNTTFALKHFANIPAYCDACTALALKSVGKRIVFIYLFVKFIVTKFSINRKIEHEKTLTKT
jgi:hypothetical protein